MIHSLIGVFNAKLGNIEVDSEIGNSELGVRNEPGQILLDFLLQNTLNGKDCLKKIPK